VREYALTCMEMEVEELKVRLDEKEELDTAGGLRGSPNAVRSVHMTKVYNCDDQSCFHFILRSSNI